MNLDGFESWRKTRQFDQSFLSLAGIHGYGIFTYMKTHKNQPFHVGKYTVRPMDDIGLEYIHHLELTTRNAKHGVFLMLVWGIFTF